MVTEFPFVQVDAFTNRAFGGNPAAIFVTNGPCDEEWMQNVAQEMNLSETAFLHPIIDGFNLRWFTPTSEVELCGHATLASAHVLWEQGHLPRQSEARFHTRSGILSAKLARDWIWLDFPATPANPMESPPELADTFGSEIVFVGETSFDYLVELPTAVHVAHFEPDLVAIERLNARGLIVTAQSEDFDFVSRYFAPAYGIPEDPVTGSAHCALGPYWANKLGRSEFTAYQASRRGGVVRVQVIGDRVKLGGQAITTVRGQFLT